MEILPVLLYVLSGMELKFHWDAMGRKMNDLHMKILTWVNFKCVGAQCKKHTIFTKFKKKYYCKTT